MRTPEMDAAFNPYPDQAREAYAVWVPLQKPKLEIEAMGIPGPVECGVWGVECGVREPHQVRREVSPGPYLT